MLGRDNPEQVTANSRDTVILMRVLGNVIIVVGEEWRLVQGNFLEVWGIRIK